MKISYVFIAFVFLFLSVELIPAMVAAPGAYAARIPEHTCHKKLILRKCHPDKCSQKCSKEPYGYGECKGDACFCMYYCKFPPQ